MEKVSSIFGNILLSLGLVLLLVSLVFFNFMIFASPSDFLSEVTETAWRTGAIFNTLISIGFILAGGLLRIKSQ